MAFAVWEGSHKFKISVFGILCLVNKNLGERGLFQCFCLPLYIFVTSAPVDGHISRN